MVDGEPGAARAKSQPHGDTPTMSVVGMGWPGGRGPGHMSTEMLWAGKDWRMTAGIWGLGPPKMGP